MKWRPVKSDYTENPADQNALDRKCKTQSKNAENFSLIGEIILKITFLRANNNWF